MRQISPVGLSLAKILVGLLALEILLFGVGKLVARGRPIVSPPQELSEWTASPADPPVLDSERDSPRQISVIYTNGDQAPVRVDIAAVGTINGLRLPQKYLVDTDGRVNPLNSDLMVHRGRRSFAISLMLGIEKSVVDVHWFQTPGGLPVVTAADASGNAARSLLLRKPQLYECDVWQDYRPTADGRDVRRQLQLFADRISDMIKSGG